MTINQLNRKLKNIVLHIITSFILSFPSTSHIYDTHYLLRNIVIILQKQAMPFKK